MLLPDVQSLQTDLVRARRAVSVARLARSRESSASPPAQYPNPTAQFAEEAGSQQYRSAGICGVVSFGPRYSECSDNHQAGDADPLAPRWVSKILAVEIESSRWPAKDKVRGSTAHSRDECCESVLGSNSDPRRAPQARHQCRADDGCQVYGSGKATTVSGMEDVSSQPCRWYRVDGPVRGPVNLVPAVIWAANLTAWSS